MLVGLGGGEREVRVVEGAGFNLSCHVAVPASIDSKVGYHDCVKNSFMLLVGDHHLETGRPGATGGRYQVLPRIQPVTSMAFIMI